jgi:predicted RNA binding protein YcfA (HicA-like mRNA interferase family)
MSKRDKLRRKLRNNPKGVQFTEIETLLLRFGFVLLRIKGSHHIFQYHEGERTINIVVPVHSNQVKIPYVKDTIEILDELFPELPAEVEDKDE